MTPEPKESVAETNLGPTQIIDLPMRMPYDHKVKFPALEDQQLSVLTPLHHPCRLHKTNLGLGIESVTLYVKEGI